jgi:hypothetical protein
MIDLSSLHAVQALAKRDRVAARSALNALFRTGTPPVELNGRCSGELLLLDVAPGLTPLVTAITRAWLPWKGKTFNACTQRGDNIFTTDSRLLAEVFNPFYRGFVPDGPLTYRAFAFRTYVAPGRADPDRDVLKIDYNLPENPPLTLRRVLDELVQVEAGHYLGKAHVQWWWGTWQCVAFFALWA